MGINTGFVKSANNLVTSVTATPVAAGSGYHVGDVLNLTTGGSGAKVIVTAITSTSGGVASVSLLSCGTSASAAYTVTTSATTAFTGAGTSCTVAIATVGYVIRVTTTSNHFYKIGDTVALSGATDANYNVNVTVVGVDSAAATTAATWFDCIPSPMPAATAVATATSTTSLLVDSTKSWVVSGLVGMLVQVQNAIGTSGAIQTRKITANTATSITVDNTITLPTNQTRFLIHDSVAYGRAQQYHATLGVTNVGNTGWATSGATTSLTDSTKNWIPNMWTGYRLQIISGTGYMSANNASEFAITGNTATTLSYSAPGFTVDTTTKYRIMDTWGISDGSSSAVQLNDATKNWAVNQWSGKRVRFLSGAGQAVLEYTINTNTATALVFTSGTSPSTTTYYTIVDPPVHGAGMELIWTPNVTDTTKKGKEIWRPTGGGTNRWDIYDIGTQMWRLAPVIVPQSETFTTGSMYSYDGANGIIIQKDATGRLFQMDLANMDMNPAGMIPFGMSTALIGNRLDMITTTDGLKIIYMLRHTGTTSANEYFKCLYWWY